jgi:AbrB family looped-hinge helix DNA binding protein
METRLDKFGRIVVPKDVRDGLGLRPGDALMVRETPDGIYLQPLSTTDSSLREINGVLVFDGVLDEPIQDVVAWARAEREGGVLAAGGKVRAAAARRGRKRRR